MGSRSEILGGVFELWMGFFFSVGEETGRGEVYSEDFEHQDVAELLQCAEDQPGLGDVSRGW